LLLSGQKAERAGPLEQPGFGGFHPMPLLYSGKLTHASSKNVYLILLRVALEFVIVHKVLRGCLYSNYFPVQQFVPDLQALAA